MFLAETGPRARSAGVPRRCGGVPAGFKQTEIAKRCSPQVRGCSLILVHFVKFPTVFPAGAGVFPLCSLILLTSSCVPRRCGGVPEGFYSFKFSGRCSPQVRGCSDPRPLDPKPLKGVPRRCGGVPEILAQEREDFVCSPQVRGCSPQRPPGTVIVRVFPAGAGVFLALANTFNDPQGVPRRCGGVPAGAAGNPGQPACSPQVRGCSQYSSTMKFFSCVFPAGAGVFL